MDNPSAFPSQELREQDDADWILHPGMTLRDYFAGQALAMSQPDGPASLADWAYRVADAMLAERAKDTPSHG